MTHSWTCVCAPCFHASHNIVPLPCPHGRTRSSTSNCQQLTHTHKRMLSLLSSKQWTAQRLVVLLFYTTSAISSSKTKLHRKRNATRRERYFASDSFWGKIGAILFRVKESIQSQSSSLWIRAWLTMTILFSSEKDRRFYFGGTLEPRLWNVVHVASRGTCNS